MLQSGRRSVKRRGVQDSFHWSGGDDVGGAPVSCDADKEIPATAKRMRIFFKLRWKSCRRSRFSQTVCQRGEKKKQLNAVKPSDWLPAGDLSQPTSRVHAMIVTALDEDKKRSRKVWTRDEQHMTHLLGWTSCCDEVPFPVWRSDTSTLSFWFCFENSLLSCPLLSLFLVLPGPL